ncbi:MAG: fumarylacetoacetate hydrolase family protein [Bacteroidales bacterium]|nr:fumarylacetoacetate hydrolase family protein [Bacteroidales bacterium]MDY6346817.1 fumarylacetoacetate hydrolase family protein [Bacteroidales bacterium]
MKFICIGRNYAAHAAELNHSVPEEPVFFLKPESAITRLNRPFFLPDFSEEVHYETEIIVKINRLGKCIPERFAHKYYDEIGLGVDFTARDIQRRCVANGEPWEVAKAFDGSAVVGRFTNKSNFPDLQSISFHLLLNGKKVQSGNTSDMIFSIDRIISHVSRFMTLKMGDIIFTGTPVGVGRVEINDRLQGFVEDECFFDFRVK